MNYLAERFRTLAIALATVLLSNCGGGGGYGGGGGGSTTYTVGGTVSGLSGTVTLVLQDNGGDDRTITADGLFTFATALPYLAGYNVTVLTQPAGQTCLVSNGTGTVGLANVTNVAVACGPVPAVGDLVITEVMANPAGGQQAKEWFEVVNTTPHTLRLDGLVVTRDTQTFTVPPGTTMAPGQYFVFAASNDTTANAGLTPVNVVYGPALQLTNTTLTLSLSLGATTLDTVVFATSTSGRSLSLDPTAQNPTANDDVAANWCLSTTTYGDGTNQGTPGAPGAACP